MENPGASGSSVDGMQTSTQSSATAAVTANPEQYVPFIMEQLHAGTGTSLIVQKLTDMGMDRFDAVPLVAKVQAQVAELAEQEKATVKAVLPAGLGGLLAAVLAGIAWAVIVIKTDHEYGAMAIAVGFIVGYAVKLFARGKLGRPLQLAAAVCSVLGIAIGKYATVFWLVRDAVTSEYGAQAAAQLSPFSLKFLQFFAQNVGAVLSVYDVMWVGLAIYAAWRIPQASGWNFPKR